MLYDIPLNNIQSIINAEFMRIGVVQLLSDFNKVSTFLHTGGQGSLQ